VGIWREGKEEFQATWDGKRYWFASRRAKQRFLSTPEPYIPAFGGACVVSHQDRDRQVAGSIQHAALYEGRLYLFAGAAQKTAFQENPSAYAEVDLAYQGKCVVTQREEGRQIKGNPKYLAWHQNRRYLFSSARHRQKFNASPELYLAHLKRSH
jgi:YHS domain-containing protein